MMDTRDGRAPDSTYSARAMWLRMYAEGGRWTRADLLDAFGVDVAMDVDLWQMGNDRHIRHWGYGPQRTYGITLDCLAPPWLTVAELQAPLQAAHHVHAQAA